uniref:DUF7768 domain-containing protein n=1 Tax=Candidatus Kentrum sp. TC TaxID=2126339 RepID=A0A450Z8V1_9GAMM|nr:MAG: hypothetical protein BECKTC1821D_GA0114238_10948 [Candidatus Kentron sp. TC]
MNRNRIFICSPYAGDIENNAALARALCAKAIDEGFAPFAPHLLYPDILGGDEPPKRDTGIECGLAFLECCSEVWIPTDGVTSVGMEHEIKQAKMLGLPIRQVQLKQVQLRYDTQS